jgi:hypothetical protein
MSPSPESLPQNGDRLRDGGRGGVGSTQRVQHHDVVRDSSSSETMTSVTARRLGVGAMDQNDGGLRVGALVPPYRSTKPSTAPAGGF